MRFGVRAAKCQEARHAFEQRAVGRRSVQIQDSGETTQLIFSSIDATQPALLAFAEPGGYRFKHDD